MSAGATSAIAHARAAALARPKVVRPGRCGMALGGAHHVDRAPRQVPGALRGTDDDGGGAVALETAVEQSEGVGDHARGLMILDRDGLGHDGVAVKPGVSAGRDGDLTELTR